MVANRLEHSLLTKEFQEQGTKGYSTDRLEEHIEKHNFKLGF